MFIRIISTCADTRFIVIILGTASDDFKISSDDFNILLKFQETNASCKCFVAVHNLNTIHLLKFFDKFLGGIDFLKLQYLVNNRQLL